MQAWKSRAHSREAIALAAVIAAAAGCGGDGVSETTTGTGGSGSSSNTTGSMASSSASTTTTGTMAGTGGGSSTGSSTGSSMAGTGGAATTGTGGAAATGTGGAATAASTGAGGSSACPTPASQTVATHITMAVTWPGTIGIEAGSGTVHIWTLSTQMFNGNSITGTGRPCGSLIPDLKATPLAGGMMIGNTIPDAAWESPSMPVSMITGTHGGFDVGSTVTIDKNATVVGATMPNPLTDVWPMSYTGLMTADHDADSKPGITAIPKTAPGFQLPPVNLFMNPKADRLYLATRSILSLSGTRDTCDTVTGTALMEKFDNHVVGCRIQNGGDCMPAEANFVDTNRTVFVIGTATYKAMTLPAGATCADARAALP
jgi:hypothetical protein